MLSHFAKDNVVLLPDIEPDNDALLSKRNNLVRKAFAILKGFNSPDERLTCQELSLRANLPKASGHRLVQTLEEIGAVVRGPQGRYQLGMLFISFSHNVAPQALLRRVADPILHQLAEDLRLTVHMGVLNNGMVTYLSKITVPGSFRPHTQLGTQLEAYCTGLGKVLLAGLPGEQLDSFILDGELVALTTFTITSPDKLYEELAKVRYQGYADDNRETCVDMRCVAVPVRDVQGRVIAAISCTGSVDQVSADNHRLICQALARSSGAITARLYPDI